MNFYTYFHTRNDTGAVFYVGKGKGKRLQDKGCEYLIDYEFPIRESYNRPLQLKGAI